MRKCTKILAGDPPYRDAAPSDGWSAAAEPASVEGTTAAPLVPRPDGLGLRVVVLLETGAPGETPKANPRWSSYRTAVLSLNCHDIATLLSVYCHIFCIYYINIYLVLGKN